MGHGGTSLQNEYTLSPEFPAQARGLMACIKELNQVAHMSDQRNRGGLTACGQSKPRDDHERVGGTGTAINIGARFVCNKHLELETRNN
jgi:hypothetical protein